MNNKLRTKLVCLQSQAALPSFPSSVISSETLYWEVSWGGGGVDVSSCSVERNLFSFSANRTEADGRYDGDEPSCFDATQLSESLGDDMTSLSPQPSSSDNQSP